MVRAFFMATSNTCVRLSIISLTPWFPTMNFNAPILVIVPPTTAAGSRSDPRLGLGVIYGDFGEAALLMQRTRQKVWCWLIGHDGVTRRQGAG